MIYQEVKDILEEKGLTIAFAESMTGGFATYKLTEIPGASNVLKGSIISYSKESKIGQLDILESHIDEYGIVSKEIALEMAQNVRVKFNSNIGIGVTGDAGPTLQKASKKLGTYYAICLNEACETYHISFDHLTRIEAQKITVEKIYESLYEVVKKSSGKLL